MTYLAKILFCVGLTSFLSAQNLEGLYFPDTDFGELPYNLATEVHSFDEFIGRYNGQLDAFGQKLNENHEAYKIIRSDSKAFEEFRFKVIGSLLSQELMKQHEASAVGFAKRASSGPKLDFKDSNWQATIPFKGIWKSSSITGNIILKSHFLDEERSKWVIIKVIFEDVPEFKEVGKVNPDICDEVYLPPTAHENGFIALNRILKGKEAIENHILKTDKELNRFAYLLNKGFRPSFSEYFFNIDLSEKVKFILNSRFEIIGIN